MNGINGMNARTLGVSRDMVKAAQGQVRGKFVLCMDDPQLVADMKAMGATTLYRQSGDDPAHNPLPASDRSADIRAAARAFTDERGRKGADYLHLTNELASTPKLHEFTRACLERCVEAGWRGVAYSYATHTPRQQYVDALDNLRYAVATGQTVGVHLYPDVYHDATVAEFLDIRRALGGVWIATEFNYTRSYTDPHRGWRSIPEAELRAWGFGSIEAFRRAFIRQWSRALAAEQIPACYFSLDPWDQPTVEAAKAEGYGYWDLPDVLDEMAAQNRIYVFKGGLIMPDIPAPTTGGVKATLSKVPNGQFVNIREQPNRASGSTNSSRDVGDLLIGDEVTWYPGAKEGEWAFVTPLTPVPRSVGLQNAAPGWVSLQGDAVQFTSASTPNPSHPTPSEVERALAALDAALLVNTEFKAALDGMYAANAAQRIAIENAIALLHGEMLPDAGGGF